MLLSPLPYDILDYLKENKTCSAELEKHDLWILVSNLLNFWVESMKGLFSFQWTLQTQYVSKGSTSS